MVEGLAEQSSASTGSTLDAAGRMPFTARKTPEAMEDWLRTQLLRQQQQTESLIERSVRGMEGRLQAMENERVTVLRELEISVAEMRGSVKALSEEFESQAVGIDALETRQFEWRQSVEESLRARLGELERQLKNCATNAFKHCAANEESLSREKARLQTLEDRAGGFDLGASRICDLEALAENLRREVERLDQAAQAFDPSCYASREESQWEQRAAGMAAKIDPLMKEMDTMRERAQEQETRLGTLKVNLEMQDKKTHSLMERFEASDMGLRSGGSKDVPNMLDLPLKSSLLFEDGSADAAMQLQAQQWLHSEDEPVRNLGVLSDADHGVVAEEGKRELMGLCETVRADDCEEQVD